MSKYNARRTEGPNGRIYASAKEAKRAWELRLLELAGKISGLQEQVSYTLLAGDKAKGWRPVRYVADFTYLENGQLRCEDVKGMRTPVYKLKKRMVEQMIGVTITEV